MKQLEILVDPPDRVCSAACGDGIAMEWHRPSGLVAIVIYTDGSGEYVRFEGNTVVERFDILLARDNPIP